MLEGDSPPEASLLSPSLHSKEGVELPDNFTAFSKQLAISGRKQIQKHAFLVDLDQT
jgi:hypothetical protein